MGAFTGLLKIIRNYIIEIIAIELKENIYQTIRDAQFFSIQVDEITD